MAKTENQLRCRICLFGLKCFPNDILITPCNCNENFAYVHSSCISRWVEVTGHEFCHVCKLKFIMTKRQKSFCEWLHDQNQEREELKSALIVLLYSAFQLLFVLYVCTKLQELGKFYYLIVK